MDLRSLLSTINDTPVLFQEKHTAYNNLTNLIVNDDFNFLELEELLMEGYIALEVSAGYRELPPIDRRIRIAKPFVNMSEDFYFI